MMSMSHTPASAETADTTSHRVNRCHDKRSHKLRVIPSEAEGAVEGSRWVFREAVTRAKRRLHGHPTESFASAALRPG